MTTIQQTSLTFLQEQYDTKVIDYTAAALICTIAKSQGIDLGTCSPDVQLRYGDIGVNIQSISIRDCVQKIVDKEPLPIFVSDCQETPFTKPNLFSKEDTDAFLEQLKAIARDTPVTIVTAKQKPDTAGEFFILDSWSE